MSESKLEVSYDEYTTGADTTSSLPQATPDQEEWLIARIETALHMVLALKEETHTGADVSIFKAAKEGVVHGCVREVLGIMKIRPAYVNLREYPR